MIICYWRSWTIWSYDPWPPVTRRQLQSAIGVKIVVLHSKCNWEQGADISACQNIFLVHSFNSGTPPGPPSNPNIRIHPFYLKTTRCRT